MQDLYTVIHKLISLDPGDRGLLCHIPAPDFAKAADLLQGAQSVLIVTGFPILTADTGENDGPIGAASLAYALHNAGKSVSILTDPLSDKLVRACLDALGADSVPVLSAPVGLPREEMKGLARSAAPQLVVAIERPGKSIDGAFRNMRGLDISHMTADTDCVLDLGLPTICVGDGGNELGMGNYKAMIEKYVLHGEVICAQKTCDLPMAAGISNWGGWALAAILSAADGRNYMTTPQQEQAMLDAIAKVGGVDGVFGRISDSVDGLAKGGIDEVFVPMREAVLKHLK